MTNVLVIGSGGREHAICWKLSQSPNVKKIYASPGSLGIAQIDKAGNVTIDLMDFKALSSWCKDNNIGLVVVGPEDPLAVGVADSLKAAGIHCFGPSAAAARIEADKAWAKTFMHRHNIPTARFKAFTDPVPAKDFINSADFDALVVKASGLAAGKGVVVAADKRQACYAVDTIFHKFGKAGETIVVEELLQGEEVSVLGFCDGSTVRVMLPAQDHKRIFNGDKGANTGGMGAYCPCTLISEEQLQEVTQSVLQRTLNGLSKEGHPFVGVLYAGLMMTKDGPKVLEFNCRFGDPETQVILPLLNEDLFNIMMACCQGSLSKIEKIHFKECMTAVGVVMASDGYPEKSSKGDRITGVDIVANTPGMLVFHSGVRQNNSGALETAGGRVLINVCLAPSLELAAASATRACSIIKFPGAQFRTDIAHKGIPRWMLGKGRLSYKASGVDISAGEALVECIKPAASRTVRTGTLEGLGGFGALFSPRLAGYKDPILVSGTDGVGTKLKLAFDVNDHRSVGQDLVAMCVNDIVCHGAEPLFFLDYFACGKLEVGVAHQVIKGIANACHSSGCALVGGETAEMPGLYKEGEYDLGGFAVGAVESGAQLPRDVKEDDVIVGIPSSGVHSNGFSLVRKIISHLRLEFSYKCPFASDQTIGSELLKPTRLYIEDVLPLVKKGCLKALAHITGGGLLENIPRALPFDLKACIDASQWTIPPVFPWLAASGGLSEREMLRTFNCGVGMVVIADKSHQKTILSAIPDATVIGHVAARKNEEPQVEVANFVDSMEPLMKPYVQSVVTQAASRKRIGVLISGAGTNLQALIDAIGAGELDGDIVVVISNKAGVEGLKRAARAGIATKVVKHQEFVTREQFEACVDNELRRQGVELVVLAGFMRVLTNSFVSKWRGRLINIHPALLPLFKGTDGPRQAIEAGVRVSGCTVHFVEADVDAGAIIVQEVVPVLPKDTKETLSDRIRLVEHKALPKAVQLVCTSKVHLDLSTGTLVWM